MAHGLACAGIGLEHGLQQQPVDQTGQPVDCTGQQHQRRRATERVGEQVAAQPDPGCGYLIHERSAQRPLRRSSQPLSHAVSRERIRYTTMIRAMHSAARPVWFSVVLATDTRSG